MGEQTWRQQVTSRIHLEFTSCATWSAARQQAIMGTPPQCQLQVNEQRPMLPELIFMLMPFCWQLLREGTRSMATAGYLPFL